MHFGRMKMALMDGSRKKTRDDGRRDVLRTQVIGNTSTIVI